METGAPVIGRYATGKGGSYVAAEGPDYRGRVFIAEGRDAGRDGGA